MASTSTQPLIAVVDDDISVRKSLCRLIRSFGYEVESFESAEDYLEADHSNGPQCLVLDVHMPGLSGFELQERLRDTGDETAVVFITAHADATTRARALGGGAVDLLAKPFSDDDLKADLERGVEETQARQG